MSEIEDLFAKIAAHMIKGIMMHDQMANYYSFLNLKGYAKCHKYHFLEENKNYIHLKHYYLKYHRKLIKEFPVEDPKVIPSSWYSYKKEDIDINTKRNAVKTGLEKWIKWEQETKDMLEMAYKDLINWNSIADATFLTEFIKDVDCELAKVEKYYIEKQDCDFSMASIIEDQKCKKEKYKEKIRGIEW